MTDIEIAENIKMEDIVDIAKKLNIDDIELYGKNICKIDYTKISGNRRGKLILVTSINPTPFGEGKTTMSIGINDALNMLGKKSIVTLREPSLGPVFGIKGGATGGGYSQVVPMENINLHFTGDIHAIESANNLLSAAIDNHIYFGNELKFKTVEFNRCMDMNDRALRNIKIGYGLKENIVRDESFSITTATEIMAILCLSKNLSDLKERLSNILIGYDVNDNPIYSRQLKIEDALTIILKDAIKPNLVQTLEHNPAIIHGGPFANIAHGCNSIIATDTALKLADYVVTEAGFGSDLGAEKFIDIKCRLNDLNLNAIVVNATIRSLKYNGGCEKDKLEIPSVEFLEKGICNLKAHVLNMKNFNNNVIVCLNKFNFDSKEEIEFVQNYCKELDVECYLNTSYQDGGKGAIDVANALIKICDKYTETNYAYDLSDGIEEKILKLAKNIYHASDVKYSDNVLDEIKKINRLGYSSLPICVAKTQYSLSDDAKLLGFPIGHTVTVTNLKICSGAGFIVVYMKDIMTMPGLSRRPNYENMYIKDNKIKGLF